MRATAAIVSAPGGPFQLREVELEAPRTDEVLVRMVSVGVCATDLEVARHATAPTVLGHEGAGVVEAVGSAVSSVAVGDHVAMAYASCGRCRLCLSGTPSYCRRFDELNFTGRRPDGSSAVRLDGAEIDAHFLGQSSFATAAVVPERAVVRLDVGADLRHVGPFGCGVQTGAGAVLNVLKPGPGAALAVFGVGSVGTAAVLAAGLAGCSTIVAVDLSPARLDSARRHGATHTIDPGAEPVADRLAAIAPDGLDVVIDTTGRQDVLRSAVDALGPLGRAGVIGIGPSESMSFTWSSFLNGRTVTGIVSGGTVPQVFVPQLLALHAAGRFPVDDVFSYAPFTDIDAVVGAVQAGELTKAVLTF